MGGFKRRVVRVNLVYAGFKNVRTFRFRLCRAAAGAFLAFLFGPSEPSPLDEKSLRHLQAMRRGPSLLLTAHFHNWEKLGESLGVYGVPVLAAAQPLRRSWANRVLIRARRRLGISPVSDSVPRKALRHLRDEGCFVFLWDQHSPDSRQEGVFLGRSVRVNPLPIFLMRHEPVPVFFGALDPIRGLRLIPLMHGWNGDWEKRLIRRYHRLLEVLVRRHPEYWYGFFHRRFKNSAVYLARP